LTHLSSNGYHSPAMSAWRGGAIGAGVVAVLAGILLGTGVISVRKRDDGTREGGEGDARADSDGAAEGGKKRRVGKGKPKGKKGKRGGGEDDGPPPDPAETGVVKHVKGKTFDGLTLINPVYRPGTKGREVPVHEAELWDIEGKKVHAWSADDAFDKKRGWTIARIDPDGWLYVVMPDTGVVKLDWEGNTAWKVEDVFHHDLSFDKDGGVVVLLEEKRDVPHPEDPDEGTVGILDHLVAFVDKDGKVERKLSLYDAMKNNGVFVERLKERVEDKERKNADGEIKGIDAFHATGVSLLPKDVAGLGKKGDVLVSVRHLDTVVAISRDDGKLLWSWGEGELEHQHDPSVSPEGHVVVFDNGIKRKRSRVVFVDPKTNEIVRTYDGGDDNEFFSAGRGVAQVLPNKNLLVFVSNKSRAFEVTPDDEVVWDFNSPFIHKSHRLPIRGSRLVGPTLEGVQKIVAGKAPAPKAEGAPEKDDADAKADDAKADDKKADDKKADDEKADEDEGDETE
jgi:hypothetical protein